MSPLVVAGAAFVALCGAGAAGIRLARSRRRASQAKPRARRVADTAGLHAQVLLVTAGAVLAAYFVSGSFNVALFALPLALVLPRQLKNRRDRERLKKIDECLPDALLMMSGALRAGVSFPVALAGVIDDTPAPLSQELDMLMRELRLGVDLDDALKNMAERVPSQDFAMVSAGISIAREVGGNLAESLEAAANIMQEKRQMEGRILALTSQGKMQGIVMTCLPLFLIVVLQFIDPQAMEPLFTSPIGWGTLCVVAVMETLGYASIRKITRIDV
ncbi:type II secretion system F family protein [Trinickia mobilis]|uniref:type II secretion system F family protein n=1 Tax=Trinickia mobilis TaxID=2816356 RepID=UPI001A8F74B9|nr:type II secretion system F family protein [Trinickia mobilis]